MFSTSAFRLGNLLSSAAFFAATISLSAGAAPSPSPQINQLPDSLSTLPEVIDRALTQFHTPGMAVGIIKDGEILYLAGHGSRDIANKLPVTPDTWFRLASTSKAFTATTVAMEVDKGEIDWSTPVTDILQDFQMQDPWVTREFQVIDLLTHRSGLTSGAGDSMLWPEPSGFSRQEIIHNLRYLTPRYSFRAEYAYSNVMYITAGELVAKLEQQPWESVLKEKIFMPLNMQCFGGDVPDYVIKNRAKSYGFNEERGIYPIPRNQIEKNGIVSAAAGGVSCNASSMIKWLRFWLEGGITEDGTRLLSEKQYTEMLTPQTLLSVDDTDEQWDDMQFKAYGLGWRLMDMYGHKVISHTGTLSGYQAYVAMLPSQNLGVVVLNNGSNYGARGAVMQTILKAFIPESEGQQDWIAKYQQYQDEREQKYLAKHETPKGSGSVLLPLTDYAGRFEDTWFGEFSIVEQGANLRIRSLKMPMLTGTLEPFNDHSFVIRWDNKNAANDAFIRFEVNVKRKVTGFTLHPFSVEEEENHEWKDMHFSKSEENIDKN